MTQRLPVSVVVLTMNEEATLIPCLESVAQWAGEIVIVDSGSTDGTLEIAHGFTDRVFEHQFENYARQRNWAQSELSLSYDWVLHLDADERVTPQLAAAIGAFLQAGSVQANGAMFSRRTVFMGKWIRHGGHYPVFHTRLFRRDKGACEDRRYDQHFVVEAPTVRLDGDLVDVLTSDLDTWSARHVRWAGLQARDILDGTGDSDLAGRPFGGPMSRRRWLRTRIFGRSPLFARAYAYFIYRYIFRLGFLDGVEGLIFHFLQGCWFRFYVDVKIWELGRRKAPTERVSSVTANR